MANQAHPGPPEGGTPIGARPRRRPVRPFAAIAALALIGSGVYLGVSRCSSGTPAASSPPATTPASAPAKPAGNPLTGVGTAGRVLAVKIDNVGAAQYQQTGLNS